MSSWFGFAGNLRFPRMFGFHECFQAGKAGRPEAAVLLEPVVYGTQRFRIQVVNAQPSFAVFADEVGAAEEAQMFRNCRARDRKGSRNLSRGLATAAQQVENGAAGGIRKSLEGGLGCAGDRPLRFRICNRTVTHNA